MESASLSNGVTDQGMKSRGSLCSFHMAEQPALFLRCSWSWHHCHHCERQLCTCPAANLAQQGRAHVGNPWEVSGMYPTANSSSSSARLFRNHHPPHTQSLGHFNEHKQRGSYDVHLKEINPQILALPPQQGGLQQYLLNKFLLLFLPTIYSYLVATLFFQYVHVTASRTTDQLKNTHLSPPGFVSFCPRGRQDQWGWDEALKAAQPAQLRAVGCRTEAEQRGDSRNVLLKLKMLLQPSQGGTVLPHVPHDEEQPREMLSKSQEQKKRSASQGKIDFSTPLAPSKLPAWSEILYFNIWKKPLTVQLCTVCDLQEIFKIV